MSHENWFVWMQLAMVLLVACMSGQPGYERQQTRDQNPERVPDRTTAIRIAEAVLLALHDSARLEQWRPLRASLTDGVWCVRASADEFVLLEIERADARLRHGGRDGSGGSAGGDLVPDSSTAARIAEAVLLPVYGADLIEGQKPFLVIERNGVWVVRGQLPRNMLGGVAEVEISRSDGHVLRMQHGR